MRRVLWMSLLGACSPAIPEGVFVCEEASQCPDSWFCRRDRTCWASPDVATSDAGRDAAAPDGGAPSDSGPDARSDAGMDASALECKGTSTCHLVSETTATGLCPSGTMASCVVPDGAIDCSCAPGQNVRLFFWPPSGSGGRLEWAIVMGANPKFFTGLSFQMDDRCAGGVGLVSCNVVSACPDMADGTQVYVFPVPEMLDGVDLTTSGTHRVRLFYADDGAPCDSAPELVVADYMIP